MRKQVLIRVSYACAVQTLYETIEEQEEGAGEEAGPADEAGPSHAAAAGPKGEPHQCTHAICDCNDRHGPVERDMRPAMWYAGGFDMQLLHG